MQKKALSQESVQFILSLCDLQQKPYQIQLYLISENDLILHHKKLIHISQNI